MTHDSTPFSGLASGSQSTRPFDHGLLVAACQWGPAGSDRRQSGPRSALDNPRASQGLFSTQNAHCRVPMQFEVDLLKSFAALFVTSTALRESGSSASECDSAQSDSLMAAWFYIQLGFRMRSRSGSYLGGFGELALPSSLASSARPTRDTDYRTESSAMIFHAGFIGVLMLSVGLGSVLVQEQSTPNQGAGSTTGRAQAAASPRGQSGRTGH